MQLIEYKRLKFIIIKKFFLKKIFQIIDNLTRPQISVNTDWR